MYGEISRRRALAGFGGVAMAGPATVASVIKRMPPGTRLWRSQAASSGDEPAIVAGNGMVYVTGGGRDFGDSGTYAFDATTGRLPWRIPGPRPYATGPGAVPSPCWRRPDG